MEFVVFVTAMAALIYGADFIIRESERIALHYDISSFVIGATLIGFGTPGLTGRSQVWGPGQVARTRAMAASSRGRMKGVRCRSSAAMRINPLAGGRRFNQSRRPMASSFQGSHPSP